MRKIDVRVISPVAAGGYQKGDPVDGASVTVYYAGTLVLATLYSDENLTPLSNPLTTDTNGQAAAYVRDGAYDLKVFKTSVVDFTHANVPIIDPQEATEVTINDEVFFGIMNAKYDRNLAQWNRRDTSKLARANVHNRTADVYRVVRAPSGANPISAWTTLLEINNAGKIVTGGNIDIQIFTANGTWTKPAGASYVYAQSIGPGGGAGGGEAGGLAGAGTGGGGGAVVSKLYRAADLGATVAVTVPAGGVGGAAGADGANGGTSSFGTLNAYGGGGGRASVGGTASSGGGGGGTAGAGQLGQSAASSLGGLPAQTAGAIGLSGQGGGGINAGAGQPAEYGGGGGGGKTAANVAQLGAGALWAAGGGGCGGGAGAGVAGGAAGTWGTGGGGAGGSGATPGTAGANGDGTKEGSGGGGGGNTSAAGGAGGAPGGGGGGGGSSLGGGAGGAGGNGGRGEVRVYTW